MGTTVGGNDTAIADIFVSNLPKDITVQELYERFSSFGTIKIDKKTNEPSIRIHTDKATGEGNGDAIVTYNDPASASAAIKRCDGKMVLGNVIHVEPGRFKHKDDLRGRGRGRGDFRGDEVRSWRSGRGGPPRDHGAPRGRGGNDGDRGFDSYGGVRGDQAARGYDGRSEDVVFEVESHFIGLIIGAGGRTIKQLQNNSGASIQIFQTESTDNRTPVRLSGSKEANTKAKALIVQLLQTRRPPTFGADRHRRQNFVPGQMKTHHRKRDQASESSKGVPTVKRSAEQLFAECTFIKEESGLRIYKIPLKEKYQDVRYPLRKCDIAPPSLLQKGLNALGIGKGEKVIMVVGATGAGKTTLINGMANYIVGVEWTDDFRFQLITEQDEGGNSQAHSQTSSISAYTFHHQQGYAIDYNLTIIDTPGFGDTKGIEQDRKIAEFMKEFFSNKGSGGIDQLHAICFVMQASLARLTHAQRHVFDSILSIFGKDVAENIYLFLTFADGGPPPVLDAVTEAKIPYIKYYKFNNSALYNKSNQTENDQSDDEDDQDISFEELYWRMGIENSKTFFKDLNKSQPQSLSLTKEVLKERHQLEALIQGLQQQIQRALCTMDALSQQKQHLKNHEAEIETTKYHTYQVKEYQSKKVDLVTGTYVTNCLKCNFTCHYPCAIPNDGGKHGCAAMNNKGQDSTCTICPGHCIWQQHVNNSYRFELEEKVVTKSYADVKKKYEEASREKLSVQQVVDKMEEEVKQLKKEVDDLIIRAQKSINRLDEIALKPNPLSAVEYIKLLIQSEKQEMKSGYLERVKQLEEAKQRAILTEQIIKGAANMQLRV